MTKTSPLCRWQTDVDESKLHPCEYCGTMLDENDEVESNIAACGPRMGHYASQCREYVHAAKESYKAEAVKLSAELDEAKEWIKAYKEWQEVAVRLLGEVAAPPKTV